MAAPARIIPTAEDLVSTRLQLQLLEQQRNNLLTQMQIIEEMMRQPQTRPREVIVIDDNDDNDDDEENENDVDIKTPDLELPPNSFGAAAAAAASPRVPAASASGFQYQYQLEPSFSSPLPLPSPPFVINSPQLSDADLVAIIARGGGPAVLAAQAGAAAEGRQPPNIRAAAQAGEAPIFGGSLLSEGEHEQVQALQHAAESPHFSAMSDNDIVHLINQNF